VCEVDPIRAAEAVMDGFRVAPLAEAIRTADFLITATGCRDVVTFERLLSAKDGLVLANAGHFDVEIAMGELRAQAAHRRVRDNVEEFELPGGKRVYVLAQGRLVNLVAGDGHPVEIMDLSFSLQALSAAWLLEQGRELAPDIYPVPQEIDEEVARLFLAAQGVKIDSLSTAQREYLGL
jgi:adenosylhomocysteinase